MKKQIKTPSPRQSQNLGATCDWRAEQSKTKKSSDKSAIYRYGGNYKWKGVKTETYKLAKGNWNKIIRKVLVGDSLKTKSHVRYFEIAPGGRSSFEKHRHEHIVIGIRGSGRVFLDNRSHKISFLDVVYVSPDTPHQFLNPFNEPFGFLCVVPAKRDKPVIIKR